MAIIDKKIESKSYGHGGLFEVDDRFRAWGSNDLDKMLKQLYKIGHPIDTHFLYLNIAQKAYKQREDPKMRALFKKIAIEHASVFDALKPVLYFKIGSGKDAEAVLPSVPSFQHLAIVYTEDGEYEKAIGICDKAVKFGLRDNTKGDYPGRIERIKKKAARQGKETFRCEWSELDASNKDRLMTDINKGYKLCREKELKEARERRYDLIAISSYPTMCSKCLPFQGRTFSIGGKDPDFPPLSNAIAGGLFHEGCHHLIEFSMEGMKKRA
jgi:tetratricopeptide (TPR) repeat protein